MTLVETSSSLRDFVSTRVKAALVGVFCRRVLAFRITAEVKVSRARIKRRVLALYEAQTFRGQEQGPLATGWERERITLNPQAPNTPSGSLEIVAALHRQFGWAAHKWDGQHGDLLVAVRSPCRTFEVTTDAGRSQLEAVHVGPSQNLHVLWAEDQRLNAVLAQAADAVGHKVLCLAYHPFAVPSPGHWVDKRRYWGLRHTLIGEGADTTPTAADQPTVDCRSLDHQMRYMRVLHALTGPITALFAHAGVIEGRSDRTRQSYRAGSWNRICDPRVVGHRVGLPKEPIQDAGHWVDVLLDLPYLFHLNADGTATVSLKPFWQAVADFEREQGLKHMLDVHEACTWFSARPRRTKVGSVEGRAPCQQEASIGPVVPALHTGLAENLAAAEDLVGQFAHEEWVAAADDAANRGMGAFVGRMPIFVVASQMLDVAVGGLSRRDQQEGSLLVPLNSFILRRRSPAHDAADLFDSGGLPSLIERYALKPNAGFQRSASLHSAA